MKFDSHLQWIAKLELHRRLRAGSNPPGLLAAGGILNAPVHSQAYVAAAVYRAPSNKASARKHAELIWITVMILLFGTKKH